MPDLNLSHLNEQFKDASAEDILAWAWDTFEFKVVASSSFQTQSVALLHLISQVCPEMPIIFLDTGFHFPETLAFRDDLQKRFGLSLLNIGAVMDKSEFHAQYGEGLYRKDPDLCCYIHKVQPMQKVLSTFDAWITGVQRGQTAHRQTLPIFEQQPDGLLKIHPLLNWTKKDLWAYIDKYTLPAHPLFSSGYLSIGCAPCTRPVFPGEDERAGRWSNLSKTECGLHIDLVENKTEAINE